MQWQLVGVAAVLGVLGAWADREASCGRARSGCRPVTTELVDADNQIGEMSLQSLGVYKYLSLLPRSLY